MQKNIKHITFETLERSAFKEKLKTEHKKMGLKKIEIIAGELRGYFFGGTLDEVMPLLIKHVISHGVAAGFVSRDQKTFKIVKLNKKNSCESGSLGFIVYESRAEWVNESKTRESVFCYSKTNL